MPADHDHLAAYRENARLARELLDSSPRWAVVVGFYAALHLVEMLAAREGVHHTRHSGTPSRQTYLALHPTHRAIGRSFGVLFSASLVARYESPAARDAFPGDAPRRLIDSYLADVEAHATRYAGLS